MLLVPLRGLRCLGHSIKMYGLYRATGLWNCVGAQVQNYNFLPPKPPKRVVVEGSLA